MSTPEQEFIEHVRSCIELNEEGDMSAADVVSEICEWLETYDHDLTY
jgi:hypothetical protein